MPYYGLYALNNNSLRAQPKCHEHTRSDVSQENAVSLTNIQNAGTQIGLD